MHLIFKFPRVNFVNFW